MFIYPENLKAKPKLWLWQLRDISIIGICLIISALTSGSEYWDSIASADIPYFSAWEFLFYSYKTSLADTSFSPAEF